MKISFWITSGTRELTKENWGKTPLGGAEVSAVNLGEELLKLGNETTYYCRACIPFDDWDLHIRSHEQIEQDNSDVFICVRPHPILMHHFNKKILWSGDAFDQSSNKIFENPYLCGQMDAFVFKSKWQREKILEKYWNIEPNKAHVIYNGIKHKYFTEKQKPIKNRFIYASLWYRGLKNFIKIWPMILEHIPDAEIHIFARSSLYSTWDWDILKGYVIRGEDPPLKFLETMLNRDIGYREYVEELCQMPGMILREPIPQKMLIKEIGKSWLMLYPNTGFVESSCGVALQSLACGTPVVTMKRAGLPETVRNGGVLIEETEGWETKFVDEVRNLSWKKEKRKTLSEWGRSTVLQESWGQRAKEWQDFLKSL